jgi:DNA invertase Pin-like site-specific DNA recombinase
MKKSPETHSERIKHGLARAAAKGRKPGRPVDVTDDRIRAAIPLGTLKGAQRVNMSVSSFIRRRRLIEDREE